MHMETVDERMDQSFEGITGWQNLRNPSSKPPVSIDLLSHRRILEGEFWRNIPGYAGIDQATFLDHAWQVRQSITTPDRLKKVLGDRLDGSFYEELEIGLRRAPMAMRISPYILSLMDWNDLYRCPLRTQFIPIGRRLHPDHPKLSLDTLHEQDDSPVPGVTHRYFDKVLFLPLNSCPVYCRFCTRSYAIGLDTAEVTKLDLSIDYERWKQALAYIAARDEVEDVVISGGDAYNLRPKQITALGMALLSIPHIRRIRFATKGLAVMPQKILTHGEWVDAITRVADLGRQLHKEVAIHTHFNHPREISWISRKATGLLFERGITVRNQSVLLRGVNDDVDTMIELVRKLSYINVQPYYVYICDMVRGVEDLRTSVATAVRLEKHVRGSTAGFNTPKFVCDAPEGGGKRSIHSYEYYDRENGIAVYAAPSVKDNRLFLYFDPLHSLSLAAQLRWNQPEMQERMIQNALQRARECCDLVS